MKIAIKENEFNPSFISLYGEEKAKEQGYKIIDAPSDCCFEDFVDLEFSQEKYELRKHKEEQQQRIPELKQQLAKYKEDVEQVELFGMERPDYEEKKKKCAEIILELRKLEAEL